jgi:hypothetical protein
MHATLNHRIQRSIVRLIELSAPTLKREYVPVPLRPPVKPNPPATISLGEMMAFKGMAI